MADEAVPDPPFSSTLSSSRIEMLYNVLLCEAQGVLIESAVLWHWKLHEMQQSMLTCCFSQPLHVFAAVSSRSAAKSLNNASSYCIEAIMQATASICTSSSQNNTSVISAVSQKRRYIPTEKQCHQGCERELAVLRAVPSNVKIYEAWLRQLRSAPGAVSKLKVYSGISIVVVQ